MISNTDIRYFFDTYYLTTSCGLAWEDASFWSLPAVRNGWQHFAHVQTTSSNAVRTIRYCVNSISIR